MDRLDFCCSSVCHIAVYIRVRIFFLPNCSGSKLCLFQHSLNYKIPVHILPFNGRSKNLSKVMKQLLSSGILREWVNLAFIRTK